MSTNGRATDVDRGDEVPDVDSSPLPEGGVWASIANAPGATLEAGCVHGRHYWCRVVAADFVGWIRYCRECGKGLEAVTKKPQEVAANEMVTLTERMEAHDWTHTWMGIPLCGRCGALGQGEATLPRCEPRPAPPQPVIPALDSTPSRSTR